MFHLRREIPRTQLALALDPGAVVRQAVESMDAEAAAKHHVCARARELATTEDARRCFVRVMVLYEEPAAEGAD